ncbi:structural cement protein Gp24 [Paracandidimonas lactea]|uniref:structural cement protein Gp24 n=1 Tax=Paracandidimonas lactea TaxID=2895524 RepID=UPI001F278942|nr:hypothetical protein [Paracandidimonas lactea]
MYEDQMDIAFAGMKADSGADRVESFPVGAATLAFGVVTGTDANGLLVAGAGTKLRGITLHSHTVPGATYVTTECASVMTRGLVWAKVTAAQVVTDGGSVYAAADGTVSDLNTNTAVPNAKFRSGAVTVTGGTIALVELHNPFA